MLESFSFFESDHPKELSIRSYGRLHFGLMEICDGQPHCFGGIGLMIDHSSATMKASVAETRQDSLQSRCRVVADTYWQPRIQSILDHWCKAHGFLPVDLLQALECPRPHRGLGSGTQLACTVTALLMAADALTRNTSVSGLPKEHHVPFPMSLETLAELSQRGKRSNIGLRGFLEGGFILDRGQSASDIQQNPLHGSRTRRVSFPTAWPILILQNDAHDGDSGSAETMMFERCSHQPNSNRSAMIQLAEQEIVPAIEAVDWGRLNVALGQYGRWAGQVFEPAQGGIYRTPQIAKSIAAANDLGLKSATQSSWGPTVCAIAQDEEHAAWCVDQLNRGLDHTSIQVARAVNHGAQFVRT